MKITLGLIKKLNTHYKGFNIPYTFTTQVVYFDTFF